MSVKYRFNLTTKFKRYIPGKHYLNKNRITPNYRKLRFCYCSSTANAALIAEVCSISSDVSDNIKTESTKFSGVF